MADVDPATALEEAPGWRRGLAGLIDGAAVTAIMRARRHMRPPGAPAPPVGVARARSALAALLGPSALAERIGSPGERLMGVRTVDRRTGEPVQLWRALLLTLTAVGVRALRPRLMPRSREEEWQRGQEQLRREAAELRERHTGDEEALNAAMGELWRRRSTPPVGADAGRILLVNLALALAVRQLRRRLAPTIVVRRRPRSPHSP